jgi:hypothetical protein
MMYLEFWETGFRASSLAQPIVPRESLLMRSVVSAAAGLISLFLAAGALAHHSFSAEFDVGRPVEITGTVSTIEWTNPHAWVHLDVTDGQGHVQSWAAEMLGVIALARRGLSRNNLKAGDRVTVTGFGARDGTNTVNVSTMKRADTGEPLWVTQEGDRN